MFPLLVVVGRQRHDPEREAVRVQDARKAAREAQKIGSEFRSDFDRAVDQSKDVAKDLGQKVRGAAEEAAASGRDIAQDYLKRGKRRLSHASERVSAYADDNTAVVAVGAFAAGLLVGHFARRR